MHAAADGGGGGVWTVEGQLLAANVVRLGWATARDAETTSSTFSDVGDESASVRLSSAGHNWTLNAVRLLNGSMTSCAASDRRGTSLLMDCDVTDHNVTRINLSTVVSTCIPTPAAHFITL